MEIDLENDLPSFLRMTVEHQGPSKEPRLNPYGFRL